MSGNEYTAYRSFIQELMTYASKDIRGFERHPKYTTVLEHVTHAQGEGYLCHVPPDISMTRVAEFCRMNDRLGDPKLEQFVFGRASPSSLRYVVHARLILSYMKQCGMTFPSVVEIGCGYGGLALAMHFFASHYGIELSSYTLIDFPEPLELTKNYLSRHMVDTSHLQFVDAMTYGKDIPSTKPLFLVSNYCFSSLSQEWRGAYQQHLFPKVAHGFMTWNRIPVYDFGFLVRSETEFPMTHPDNKYVYF